jgi:PAS domain S-box-containing protein
MSNPKPSLSRAPVAFMLLIAALMVATIAYLSNRSTQDRAAADLQIDTTRQVIDATGDLLSALKDTETGQRGYLITGRQEYLDPYNSGVAAVPAILNRLKSATAAQPDEAERVKTLEPVVNAKLKELATTIELHRANRPESALEIVDTGRGKVLMDQIRAYCDEIRKTADGHEAQFAAAAQASEHRLSGISVFGSLILLGFLGLCTMTIFRGLIRREELYRESATNAELLRVTLTSIGDAVIATDNRMRITFINGVALKLTGWTEAEAIGASIDKVFDIVNESTRAVADNPLQKAIRTGVVVGLANHTVLIAKDGRELPIDDSGAPIRDADGNIVGGVLVFRDISDRRKIEIQLHQSNEQMKEFVGAAAHDLRAPLQSVNTVTQLIARKFESTLGPEGSELLGYVTTGTTRMMHLVEDLLAYAKATHFELQEGQHAIMDQALQIALENLRTEIEKTGADIDAGPLPVVAASDVHVVQLLQNLVGNALKYRGEQPPRITISSQENATHHTVRVSDNGIGIEQQYLQDIFKPFKRLHTQDLPGSGIGLATCTKIVAGYQGRIWAESEPGKGSTFYFTLPSANVKVASSV